MISLVIGISNLGIGLAYAGQEVGRIPVEDWDQLLDLIVTEREIIRCGRRETLR